MTGPRNFNCYLPKVDPEGTLVKCKPSTSNGLQQCYRSGELKDVQVLVNRTPIWNDSIGGYMLNFNGRVTKASVKNFQMIQGSNYDEVLLQFGRVDENKFTMDYTHPLTLLQAFGICLSSIDTKLACE